MAREQKSDGEHLSHSRSNVSTFATHHVVDIFEDGGEAADDQGELVLGDVDQTFLVVLCADFGVSVLVSHFNGKL